MIFVFKTNVSDVSAIKALQPFLDKYLLDSKWNFDLEDCDKILRIDSQRPISATAVKVLHDNGFECEELPD
jgi:hypothetical protein